MRRCSARKMLLTSSKHLQALMQPLTNRSYIFNQIRTLKKVATLNGAQHQPRDYEIALDVPVNANFLEHTIGSAYSKWRNVLDKYPELKTVKRKDIVSAADTLKALNYTVDDMLTKPMILYSSGNSSANRHSVLLECGFQQVSMSMLFKYITVMNKTVTMLKSYGHIPMELDVRERLRSCFTDVEVVIHATADSISGEDVTLKILRQQLLNCYLRQRIDMSDSDIAKLWKVYPRVRHKSFKSVQAMIHLLIEDLQFSKERISKNAYLLHGDADNVQRIIREIGSIDGRDIRELVYRRPKVLMSTCDSLLRTLEHVKSFGIGEDAVVRCLEVLTLGPDTVLERLRDINQIEEFRVLGSNPRILRLVHYQNKARLRLDYLNQLKVRCASLHILSCGSDAFAKYARDGSDRTKGRDVTVFLANILGKDEQVLRNLLSRHPNWCHIPVIHVKQCYDFLISKHFKPADIYENVHILLYPIKRIGEKLLLLYTPQYVEEMQLAVSMRTVRNVQLLRLVLYLIECEFHFTGDGVWTEQHTQHVENFHNLLPDFPQSLNKVYKYGMKPVLSNHRNDNSQTRVSEAPYIV